MLGLDLALAAALFHDAWAQPTRRIPGLGGDPLQALSFMAWPAHAVVHGQNPLLDTALNHPAGANLMWNTSSPALAVVVAPLIALGGPVLAYNILITAAVGLSAWCAYLAARRLVRRPSAAAIAGLLYGFSPFMQSQALGHVHLFVALTPPLMVLAVHEVLVRRRWGALRTGLLCGGLVVAQLFIAEEVLATELIMGMVGVGLMALTHRDLVRERLGPVLRMSGIAAAVAAPLAVPALLFQFLGPGAVHGVIHPQGVYVTDAVALVVPVLQELAPFGARDHYLAHVSTNLTEAVGYLGVPLIAAAVVTAVRHRRRSDVRIVATLAAVALVLSMGDRLHLDGSVTGIPLPWALAERLPLLEQVLPSRMMLYVDLGAALLLAILADEVLTMPGRLRRGLAVAGVAAVAASLVPRLPEPTTEPALPAYFTADAYDRIPGGGVALVLPYAEDYYDDSAQLWQVAAGLRFAMPEGYSIGTPQPALPADASLSPVQWLLAVQRGRSEPLTGRRRVALLDQLHAWGVDTVLVGPMDHRDAMVAALTAVLGRPPQSSGGVMVWYGVGAVTAGPAAWFSRRG